MRISRINMLYALTLILIGFWGAASSTSWTAKIPIGFGILLLSLYPLLEQPKKWAIWIALVLSLAFASSLILPAVKMYEELNYIGVFRIIIMIFVGIWAVYSYSQWLLNEKSSFKS